MQLLELSTHHPTNEKSSQQRKAEHMILSRNKIKQWKLLLEEIMNEKDHDEKPLKE